MVCFFMYLLVLFRLTLLFKPVCKMSMILTKPIISIFIFRPLKLIALVLTFVEDRTALQTT